VRVRIDAEPDELRERSHDLLRAVARYASPYAPQILADVEQIIEKAHEEERLQYAERDPDVGPILARSRRLFNRAIENILRDLEPLLQEHVAKADGGYGIGGVESDNARLHAVRETVGRHMAPVISGVAGSDMLTDEEQQAMALAPPEEDDEDRTGLALVPLAFLFGRGGEDATATPDTAKEMTAATAAKHEAAQRVRGVGHRIAAAVLGAIAAVAAGRILRKPISEVLGDMATKWGADFKRLITTAVYGAKRHGRAHAIAAEYGPESAVYKQPQPGACDRCIELYIGPDGHPRIFPLHTLEAHGDNSGRRREAWQATLGPVHPYCRCVLHHVPAGYGFNDEGELVPEGKGGIQYDSSETLERAIELEREMIKSSKQKTCPAIPRPSAPRRPKLTIRADTLEKSQLVSPIGAANSQMGNRAVHQGASGYNIKIGAPELPMPHTDPGENKKKTKKLRSTEEEDELKRTSLKARKKGILAARKGPIERKYETKPPEFRDEASEAVRADAPNFKEVFQGFAERRVASTHPNEVPARAVKKAEGERLVLRPDSRKVMTSTPPPADPAPPSGPLPEGETHTVKKRGLGEVALKALSRNRFAVRTPTDEEFNEFGSLSAACDYVWCVQKGYQDAGTYREEHGVNKVPSGAGWKFWGLRNRASP
jgi:hypothetical protein